LAPPWLVTLAKATKARAWAKAALERECKNVAAAQPGMRNTTLNTAAFNLFQIVAGGGLEEQRSAVRGGGNLPTGRRRRRGRGRGHDR
jgi:hypothetical protein